MAGQTDPAKLNWPRWAQALLIAMLVLVAAIRLIALADDGAYRAGLLGEKTTIGGYMIPDPVSPREYWHVVDIAAGGPMDKAGLRIGDLVRTDPLLAVFIRNPAGREIPFILNRDGKITNGHFKVENARQSATQRQLDNLLSLNKLAALITTLIGCFLLWRGWGNKTAMLLGTGMLPLHIADFAIPPYFGGQAASFAFGSFTNHTLILVSCLPVFALRHYEESVGRSPSWHRRLVGFYIGYCLIFYLLRIFSVPIGISLPYWLFGVGAANMLAQIGMALCLALLFAAWRNSQSVARNRNAVILFAFLAYVVGAVVGFLSLEVNRPLYPELTGALVMFNLLLAGLLGPGLLAYAVLRNRLFDLGFAVNRTLVYATVGVLVLASFALIEWAIKQAIPKAWYGGSAYFSAAIAVGLYLLFNRIHHSVERVIERLFFHKWQLNEASLRRFVRAAAHVEKPESLAGQFAAELTRFSGGARAMLYMRGTEGNYASHAGEPIDADDPSLAAMRAEQEAVVPGELGSPITAALALPMMHQAALAGFVLLGPKPSGEDYRPDEIEVIGWATQQVGLDLQAIRVRDLELTNIRLAERNQTLAELLTATAAKA
jgi:hypothetical protein